MANDVIPNSRSKSGGKNDDTNRGLVTRNTQMKYESPVTYHLKDMANVKDFEKWVKL